MEIEITKIIETKEKIEVTFPYYFKHELDSHRGEEVVIYGKITEKQVVTVKVNEGSFDLYRNYELELRSFGPSFYCYLDPEYQSSYKEFDKALGHLKNIMGDITP